MRWIRVNSDLNLSKIFIHSKGFTTNGTGFINTGYDISTYVIVAAYVTGHSNYKVIPGLNIESDTWMAQIYDYNMNPASNTYFDIRFFICKVEAMEDL